MAISLLQKKREKLERIKSHISRKGVAIIEERLAREEEQLSANADRHEKEELRKNAPQAMPKAFFEQRHMKPKQIRIN